MTMDSAVVRFVGNQILICGLKFNVVAIAFELGHQIGAPLDDSRPTGKVVENFVDDMVRDNVEEVFSLTNSLSAPSN